MPTGYDLSEERTAAILAAYRANPNGPAVARALGCCSSTVYNVCRRHSVSRLKPEERRIYTINDTFFENMRTPLQAYLLGFIAGDGYVHEGRNSSLVIGLARKDRGHLEKIREHLGSNAPIRDYLRDGGEFLFRQNGERRLYPQSSIQLHSKRLVQSLVSQGIRQAKSLTLEGWKGPRHLLPSYYLGLMDADGHWNSNPSSRNGTPIWRCGLVGSYEAMVAFTRFVAMRLGKQVQPKQKGNIFTVYYYDLAFLQDLATLLYADSPLFLPRKRLLVERMLATPRRSITDWSWLDRDVLEWLYSQYGSWKEVARGVGCALNRIYDLASYFGIHKDRPRLVGSSAQDLERLRTRFGSWRAVARHFRVTERCLGAYRRRVAA